MVMAAKLTRLDSQNSNTTAPNGSSHSRQPVQKLLDTPSYMKESRERFNTDSRGVLMGGDT